MKAAIHFLQTKWHALNLEEKKYLRWGALFVLLIVFSWMLFASLKEDVRLSKSILQMESKKAADLMEQISNIRVQIDKLGLGTQDSTQVSKINNELVTIEKDVTGVAKGIELQQIATDMEKRLDELEKIVTENGHTKRYVDSKALPFQVISVDVMSGQLFVSVDYKNQVTPLGIGDSLASWKIIDADYENVSVELANNQGQYIKINVPESVASAGVKE